MSGLSSGSCHRAADPVPITRNNFAADAMEGQYANQGLSRKRSSGPSISRLHGERLRDTSVGARGNRSARIELHPLANLPAQGDWALWPISRLKARGLGAPPDRGQVPRASHGARSLSIWGESGDTGSRSDLIQRKRSRRNQRQDQQTDHRGKPQALTSTRSRIRGAWHGDWSQGRSHFATSDCCMPPGKSASSG